jgi:DNA-binding CsgD family transcriptional regulator
VFVRAVEDGPFTDTEVEHVRRLVPIAARLLRAAACRLEAGVHGPATMLVVDGRNQMVDLTIEGSALLDDLRTTGVHEAGLPTIVTTVAIRARASRTSKHIATRVRGRSGRWLRVTAIPMEGDGGNVAVMIEPARVTDLLPILLESYGLTDRENEIVPLLARGLATKEIAAELNVSPHTVRDHVKSIYAKAAVNSRGEFVAGLFAQHVGDGTFKAAVRHPG